MRTIRLHGAFEIFRCAAGFIAFPVSAPRTLTPSWRVQRRVIACQQSTFPSDPKYTSARPVDSLVLCKYFFTPMGELSIFLGFLVWSLRKVELVIPWWLENRE